MRLIDADALIDDIKKHSESYFADDFAHEWVDKQPTIEERKTGKWINNIHDIPICDQCGYMTPYDRAIDDYEYGNYCPNCGCKMEGEQP